MILSLKRENGSDDFVLRGLVQIRVHRQADDHIHQTLGFRQATGVVMLSIPLHMQPAYEMFPRGAGGLPQTERLMDVVISLPMHSDLDEATQDKIIAAVLSFKA